jgi:hypothetical protein
MILSRGCAVPSQACLPDFAIVYNTRRLGSLERETVSGVRKFNVQQALNYSKTLFFKSYGMIVISSLFWGEPFGKQPILACLN